MTIARDRWQQHLKTRGDHYHVAARDLQGLTAAHREAGAATAALALHALAELMETCRVGRLTRHQHVLLRLGALAARAEGAAALVRRAARAAEGSSPEKSPRRFDAGTLAAMARIAAREAALTVATEGTRWAGGAGGDAAGLVTRVNLPAIQAAQAGLIADMDAVTDAVYARSTPA
jgi:alkylation response protein AidB-like acyl-CoA dehydrogenase